MKKKPSRQQRGSKPTLRPKEPIVADALYSHQDIREMLRKPDGSLYATTTIIGLFPFYKAHPKSRIYLILGRTILETLSSRQYDSSGVEPQHSIVAEGWIF